MTQKNFILEGIGVNNARNKLLICLSDNKVDWKDGCIALMSIAAAQLKATGYEHDEVHSALDAAIQWNDAVEKIAPINKPHVGGRQ